MKTTNLIYSAAENLINGNITDYKAQLKRMSKKQILDHTVLLAENYQLEGFAEAIKTVKKYL